MCGGANPDVASLIRATAARIALRSIRATIARHVNAIRRTCTMAARRFALLALLLLATSHAATAQTAPYVPGASWQHKTPTEAGINAERLKEAIDFAIAGESRNTRDLTLNHYQSFGREPFGYAIGPIKDRGDQTGLIIHKGYIVAEWGEPKRVDMTHSVTKSMLSTVVGVAFDRGMIRKLDDMVADY